MEENIKNELIKKIEQGLNEVKEGKYIPAKEGFEMLRKKYKIKDIKEKKTELEVLREEEAKYNTDE